MTALDDHLKNLRRLSTPTVPDIPGIRVSLADLERLDIEKMTAAEFDRRHPRTVEEEEAWLDRLYDHFLIGARSSGG